MAYNHYAILRNLLYIGGTDCKQISRKDIIEGFPIEFREGAEKDLVELITRNFVTPDMNFRTIGLNPEKLSDVMRMIDPDGEEYIVKTARRNVDYSK